MILSIVPGDVLAKTNSDDVIIGMNSKLGEVAGIGLRFTWQIQHNKPLPPGTVYSFELDASRKLHMIICHHLGEGGWEDSEKYIRFGMDYLWHSEPKDRKFSMVQVGTGHIGKRDGAPVAAIIDAISTSHLPVTLYVYQPPERVAVEARQFVTRPPLVAYRSWSRESGELKMAA